MTVPGVDPYTRLAFVFCDYPSGSDLRGAQSAVGFPELEKSIQMINVSGFDEGREHANGNVPGSRDHLFMCLT
jgi:hypothetical protein